MQPDVYLIAVKSLRGVAYLGDMYGSVQLAHFAIKQAVSYVDGISFEETLVPSVVYGSRKLHGLESVNRIWRKELIKNRCCLFLHSESHIVIIQPTDL